ncbi:MAG TPA: hypothetical protein DDW65_02405 [Firmicutes bacterium]|nr:hypothetical protein [Bacillota bacterium]
MVILNLDPSSVIRQAHCNFPAVTRKNWPDRVYCLNPASSCWILINEVTCRIQVKFELFNRKFAV